MNCTRCRDALSAMADGDDPGAPRDRVDRHLLTCGACRSFSAALASLDAQVSRLDDDQPSAVPGLTARIMARLDDEGLLGAATRRPSATPPRRAKRLAPDTERPAVSIFRVGLIALAIGQLLAALPALVGNMNADALHANHDLGAVELALGACFLLAALRPQQAAGFVPLLAAVVSCLTIVAVADVSAGRIAAASELPHLVDVLGLVMLIAVAREHAVPSTRTQPA